MTESILPNTNLHYLKKRFGELMTLAEVSDLFRYNSVSSARKAHSRGQFPVRLYRFKKKTGLYAKVDEVIDCINKMQQS